VVPDTPDNHRVEDNLAEDTVVEDTDTARNLVEAELPRVAKAAVAGCLEARIEVRVVVPLEEAVGLFLEPK